MIIELIQKANAARWPTLSEFLKTNLEGDPTDPNLSLNSIKFLAENLLTLALDLLFVIAVIMLLYSGFLYVSSFGEPSRMETAKKTWFYTIVGFLVVVFAKLIVYWVRKEITSSTP